MAAFNNSPGGCCCELQRGWFDQYGYNRGDLQPFQRFGAGMLAVGTPEIPYGSFEHGDWSIGSLTSAGDSCFAVTDSLVWAYRRIAGVLHLCAYDAIARTQAFATPLSALVPTAPFGGLPRPGPFAAPIYDFGALGGSLYAARVAGTQGTGYGATVDVAVFDPAGVVDRWGLRPAFHQAGTLRESVSLVGQQDWPSGCGIKGTGAHEVFFQVRGFLQSIEFVRGEIGRSGPAGEVLVGGAATVLRVDVPPGNTHYATGEWLGYDQRGDHWAGVLYHQLAPLTFGVAQSKHYEVYVDGVRVLDYELPANSTLPLWPCPVHVCHPHESLGAGYCVLTALSFVAPPTPATPDGVGAGWSVYIYQGTNLLWSKRLTTSMQQVPAGYATSSSDRWIYFRTDPHRVIADFTGGAFPGNSPTEKSVEWLIRHDGGEIIPSGQMHDMYRKIVGVRTIDYTFEPHAAVKNSLAIPNALPGSYEAMYAARTIT